MCKEKSNKKDKERHAVDGKEHEEKIKAQEKRDIGCGISNKNSLLLVHVAGILPWARLACFASTGALASTAKKNGQVGRIDILEDLVLVVAAENDNLLDSDLVQEGLDHAPDRGEHHGGVDDVHLAHHLGVVVLGNGRGTLDEAKGVGELANGDTLEVENGAALLDVTASEL